MGSKHFGKIGVAYIIKQKMALLKGANVELFHQPCFHKVPLFKFHVIMTFIKESLFKNAIIFPTKLQGRVSANNSYF